MDLFQQIEEQIQAALKGHITPFEAAKRVETLLEDAGQFDSFLGGILLNNLQDDIYHQLESEDEAELDLSGNWIAAVTSGAADSDDDQYSLLG
jgi:hypothetical protein